MSHFSLLSYYIRLIYHENGCSLVTVQLTARVLRLTRYSTRAVQTTGDTLQMLRQLLMGESLFRRIIAMVIYELGDASYPVLGSRVLLGRIATS